MSKPLHQILIEPLLTEKSVRNTNIQRYTRKDARGKAGNNEAAVTALTEQKLKKYTFRVALDANKVEIAKAIETMFADEKVKVARVNTIHMRGKQRRAMGRKIRGGGQMGKSPDWKKAIVTLTPDSPGIPMLEGV
jgi:large subunit ribosomal protein L23